jgi:hypothetical protein
MSDEDEQSIPSPAGFVCIGGPQNTGYDEWYDQWYRCPSCGKTNIARSFGWCPDCGTKLQWQEEA